MEELIGILHRENCSCVIRRTDGAVILGHLRGVKDLLRFVLDESSPLRGAEIADKVVGKGAAALMMLGGVRSVYADVMSRPAFEFLEDASITASYGVLVPNIINRAGTGICSVETLCRDCTDAAPCLPLIVDFVKSNNKENIIQ